MHPTYSVNAKCGIILLEKKCGSWTLLDRQSPFWRLDSQAFHTNQISNHKVINHIQSKAIGLQYHRSIVPEYSVHLCGQACKLDKPGTIPTCVTRVWEQESLRSRIIWHNQGLRNKTGLNNILLIKAPVEQNTYLKSSQSLQRLRLDKPTVLVDDESKRLSIS